MHGMMKSRRFAFVLVVLLAAGALWAPAGYCLTYNGTLREVLVLIQDHYNYKIQIPSSIDFDRVTMVKTVGDEVASAVSEALTGANVTNFTISTDSANKIITVQIIGKQEAQGGAVPLEALRSQPIATSPSPRKKDTDAASASAAEVPDPLAAFRDPKDTRPLEGPPPPAEEPSNDQRLLDGPPPPDLDKIFSDPNDHRALSGPEPDAYPLSAAEREALKNDTRPEEGSAPPFIPAP